MNCEGGKWRAFVNKYYRYRLYNGRSSSSWLEAVYRWLLVAGPLALSGSDLSIEFIPLATGALEFPFASYMHPRQLARNGWSKTTGRKR